MKKILIIGALLLLAALLTQYVKKSQSFCGNPKIWGPKLWYVLHVIAMKYPDNPTAEQRRAAYGFVTGLKLLLPCEKCKNHLSQHLKQNPLTFEHLRNSESFSKFIYNLHDSVNIQLGKKSPITFEELRKHYNCK